MDQTQGDIFHHDPELDKSVKGAISQLTKHSKTFERKVRPPNPKLQAKSQEIMQEVGKTRGRPLFFQFIGSGLGQGPYVELIDGSVKLDLINGIGIHILGHSHPVVVEAAVRGALSDIVMQGNLEPNEEYYKFSKKLLEIAARGSRFRHVWLSTCGTMANENAIKACRQKTKAARIVIAMDAAFSGRSTMMAEVTDNPSFKEGLPNYNEVMRIPFYDKKDPKKF